MPCVPSDPLIALGTALEGMEKQIDDWEDDDPRLEVIQAVREVTEAWSFWPPEEFGSNTALVDAEAVEALALALATWKGAGP